jgi:hypothetical protein
MRKGRPCTFSSKLGRFNTNGALSSLSATDIQLVHSISLLVSRGSHGWWAAGMSNYRDPLLNQEQSSHPHLHCLTLLILARFRVPSTMWPLDRLPLPMLATKGSYRLLYLTGVVCVAALLVLGLSQSAQQFLPNSIVSAPRPNPSSSSVSSSHESWTFEVQRDAHNYGLTSEQCDSAFPGLFAEVDNAVRRRQSNHITQKELTRDQWPAGTVRVLVWEQQASSSLSQHLAATQEVADPLLVR